MTVEVTSTLPSSSSSDIPVTEGSYHTVLPDPINNEYRYTNDDTASASDEQPSLSSSSSDVSDDEDIVERQLDELRSIFSKHECTREFKNDILKFMKNLSPATQGVLPSDCRSLRPPLIQHKFDNTVKPGCLVYFGISNVLNWAKIDLYNSKSTTVNLSINIDGLPLYQSSGVSFWPILGSIEDKPVFIVACYGGKSKPSCANQFLKKFVDEVCVLRKEGIAVRGMRYRFVLRKIVMNAPARSFILGIMNHNAREACHKCFIKGINCNRSGLASTRVQRQRGRKAMCYLQMDAEPRCSTDYLFNDNIPKCNPEANCLHEDYWLSEDENCASDDSCEEEGIQGQSEGLYKYRTILTKIPEFDLVKDIPLDYMHAVCSGIVKKLITIIIRNKTILSSENLKKANERLIKSREYYTAEFQRRPETFDKLAYWKATQFRVFILYIGGPVLSNLIPAPYFSNLCNLTAAMRLVTKKLHNEEMSVKELISRTARQYFRKFQETALELYGPEFAVYNFHCLSHIAEDYLRFGPVDKFSSFIYESALGRIKKHIHSGYKPLQQLVNVYSSRLLSVNYIRDVRSQLADVVTEYYEQPELRKKVINFQEDCEGITFNEEEYENFAVMRFKNFTLYTDNMGDRHCLIDGSTFFQLTKIIRHKESSEIYLIGKCFEQVRSAFTVPCSSSELGMISCSGLSAELHTFPLRKLWGKVYAFPMNEDTSQDVTWNVIQFLHQ